MKQLKIKDKNTKVKDEYDINEDVDHTANYLWTWEDGFHNNFVDKVLNKYDYDKSKVTKTEAKSLLDEFYAKLQAKVSDILTKGYDIQLNKINSRNIPDSKKKIKDSNASILFSKISDKIDELLQLTGQLIEETKISDNDEQLDLAMQLDDMLGDLENFRTMGCSRAFGLDSKPAKDAKVKDSDLPSYNEELEDKIYDILDELNINYDGDVENGIALNKSDLVKFENELNARNINYDYYNEDRSPNKQGITFFDSKKSKKDSKKVKDDYDDYDEDDDEYEDDKYDYSNVDKYELAEEIFAHDVQCNFSAKELYDMLLHKDDMVFWNLVRYDHSEIFDDEDEYMNYVNQNKDELFRILLEVFEENAEEAFDEDELEEIGWYGEDDDYKKDSKKSKKDSKKSKKVKDSTLYLEAPEKDENGIFGVDTLVSIARKYGLYIAKSDTVEFGPNKGYAEMQIDGPREKIEQMLNDLGWKDYIEFIEDAK